MTALRLRLIHQNRHEDVFKNIWELALFAIVCSESPAAAGAENMYVKGGEAEESASLMHGAEDYGHQVRIPQSLCQTFPGIHTIPPLLRNDSPASSSMADWQSIFRMLRSSSGGPGVPETKDP